MSDTTDLMTPCEYDEVAKAAFHRTARKYLSRLARALNLRPKTDYDLRVNKGGIAVSGEVTLHADFIYVQVAQGFMFPHHAILVRTCKDRLDYTGGPNNLLPMQLLLDPPSLAREVRRIAGLQAVSA